MWYTHNITNNLLIQLILLKNVIIAGKEKKEQNEGQRTGSNSDNLLKPVFFL